MADLNIRIGRFVRSPISAPGVLPNLDRLVPGETLHVSDAAVVASLGLSRMVTGETLHVVSNTVTRNWQGSGIVTFQASAGHATVTNYTVHLWTYPGVALEDSVSLGVPTPDGNGVISVNLTSFFTGQTPGNYTVTIVATDTGGDGPPSEHSSPFTLPM